MASHLFGTAIRSAKSHIPWWAKIAAKVILARIPLSYRIWKSLGLFEHGGPIAPAQSFNAIAELLNGLDWNHARTPDTRANGFTILELGPGDTLTTAVIARALGAKACYLVDVGRYASRDIEPYRDMAAYLRTKGYDAADPTGLMRVEDILAACNGIYLTDGLHSLRQIPDRSVDLVYSNAVLEHIRKHTFRATMLELRRIIRDDGYCDHTVDLADHLGGALNNLRFSEHVWESDMMAGSGFYTNRIGYQDMLEFIRAAGFDVDIKSVTRWPAPPTPRERLAAPFRDRPDEDLLVRGFNVITRPAAR